MASQYDPFWQKNIDQIKTAIERVALAKHPEILLLSGIDNYGSLIDWHGTFVIHKGEIIRPSKMAHTKALARLISKQFPQQPAIPIRLSFNNHFQLTIKPESTATSPKLIPVGVGEGTATYLPAVCPDLHRYFWSHARHHYPFSRKTLPRNGVYVLFEAGEEAHNGERIVYIGTHLADGRLPDRIQIHFSGTRDNSTFRNHVGQALDWNRGVRVSESEISVYIQSSINFSTQAVTGSVEVREAVERQVIQTISSCSEHSPSIDWLGLCSPDSTIRASGLWNVQGVFRPAAHSQQSPEAEIVLPSNDIDIPDNINQEIYLLLIRVAKMQTTTNYGQIAPLVGLNMNKAEDRSKIGQILEQISTFEHKNNRPMLTAVVVKSWTSQPGKGFFNLASRLGLYIGSVSEDEFFAAELNRIYRYWSTTNN